MLDNFAPQTSKVPPLLFQPNSQFGLSEIRSFLGQGGIGEVYLAYDSRLRRQVAIKLLPSEFTENKARLSRFEREAYAAQYTQNQLSLQPSHGAIHHLRE